MVLMLSRHLDDVLCCCLQPEQRCDDGDRPAFFCPECRSNEASFDIGDTAAQGRLAQDTFPSPHPA